MKIVKLNWTFDICRKGNGARGIEWGAYRRGCRLQREVAANDASHVHRTRRQAVRDRRKILHRQWCYDRSSWTSAVQKQRSHCLAGDQLCTKIQNRRCSCYLERINCLLRNKKYFDCSIQRFVLLRLIRSWTVIGLCFCGKGLKEIN